MLALELVLDGGWLMCSAVKPGGIVGVALLGLSRLPCTDIDNGPRDGLAADCPSPSSPNPGGAEAIDSKPGGTGGVETRGDCSRSGEKAWRPFPRPVR